MNLTVNQRRKLKQARTLLIAGTLLGLFYVIFSDGFEKFYPFLNAAIGGFLVAAVIAILEIWVLAGGVRKLSFFTLLLLRTLLYIVLITLIILGVIVISWMIRNQLTLGGVFTDPTFTYYIFEEDFFIAIVYAMTFALSINFTRMLSRKMGQGMLLSYITGTYFHPVIQERIVMFLDVANSKEISEKLGPLNFHNFLNDLFYDITEPIVLHRGIIYEYVEDLVVITWAINKGLTNGNCIRTFFSIKDNLDQLKEKYYLNYGFSPKIRAGLHCGNLVRAEIGDVKTQIVFHGDVMNTTSRILEKSRELDKGMLASTHLMLRIQLPNIYESDTVGIMNLKGKDEAIELYNITEKEPVIFT